jgi:hypothetical protein
MAVAPDLTSRPMKSAACSGCRWRRCPEVLGGHVSCRLPGPRTPLAETPSSRRMDGSDRCQVGVVEGYSGAGKGFFAGHLAAVPGAEVINSDDLVPGWSGRAE